MKIITVNSPISAIKWPMRFLTVITSHLENPIYYMFTIKDIYKNHNDPKKQITHRGYISGLFFLRGVGLVTLKGVDKNLREAGLPSILVLGPRKRLENMSMFDHILRQAGKVPKTEFIWHTNDPELPKCLYCSRCSGLLGTRIEDAKNFCPHCGATLLTSVDIHDGDLRANKGLIERWKTHVPVEVPFEF